jgi:hypothetical protein
MKLVSMSSNKNEEKAEVNRQNASHSTGPRTFEGKMRSRMNALKHGMCAKVIPLPNEDPAEVAAREQAFIDQYQPKTPRDAFLVHVAALATLQFDRCHRFETAELGHQVRAAFMTRETARDEHVERCRMTLKTEGEIAIHGLRRSAQGCFYLIYQWAGLRDALKTRGFWSRAQWEKAHRLDDEFPSDARLLIGAQDPSDHAQERAFVIAWIEAMLAELCEREENWRAIEDADRAALSERALMIADAGLAARVLRYRNASLSAFFRSTNELEKGAKERLGGDSRNEATPAEDAPQSPELETSCDDPPASDPPPAASAPVADSRTLDEKLAAVRKEYNCSSNVATRSYTQTPQFNALPIRNL